MSDADEARERAEKLDRARAFWQRACVHDGGRAVNCVECLAEFAQGERAAEREACAMIAQEDSAIYAGRDIAEAIRARGSRSPEAPFVDIAGIAPDFTGGVESAEYIKQRWAGKRHSDNCGSAYAMPCNCASGPDAQASPSAQEPATRPDFSAPDPPPLCYCPDPCEVHPHDPDKCPNCFPASPEPPQEKP